MAHDQDPETGPDLARRRWHQSVLALTVWVGSGSLGLFPGLHTFATFSDLPALYLARHLADHALPYVHQPIEYPVLLGWWMWITAWAPGGESGYLAVNVLALWAAGVGVLALLRRVVPAHYHWFGSLPLLLVYGTQNWDLLALLPLVALWDAWERHRPGWTGVWIAVGTATKLFPIIAWPFVALAGWRAGDRRGVVTMTAWAAGLWAVINLPMVLWAPAGWSWFWRFNAVRPAGDDLWSLLGLAQRLSVGQVDGWSLVITLAVAGACLLAMGHGLPARTAMALTFVGFFAVNKVYSPQYTLWVFTAAVLAEWPVWALVMLTVGGLTDWINTYELLLGRYLAAYTGERAQQVFWRPIYPWGLGLRYGALGGAAANALKRWRARTTARTPPAFGA